MQKIKLTCMCVYSSLSDIFFPPNQLNCKTTSGEVFWSCSNSQITDSYGSFHRFDSTASVNLDFDFGRYVVSNRLSLLRPQSIPQFIIHDEMAWRVYMTYDKKNCTSVFGLFGQRVQISIWPPLSFIKRHLQLKDLEICVFYSLGKTWIIHELDH